ncbi:MAG: hypothetical protein EP315_01120 [Gammaproteobacteria bacterium]|nr:MAG: hypothetical protein EP315_01120 [Gammaproteobacteria bacterium]
MKFKWLWLLSGYGLIAFIVQQTLTSSPMSVSTQFSDKFLHTVGYFVLMSWFMQIHHRLVMKITWAIFFLLMGVGLEFLQGWSGVRMYEINDMLANGLGVFLALALSFSRFSSLLYWFENKFLSRAS